eukprot:scaffold24270_cov57-Phaeocystis_antarctica.AAC.1
MPLPLLAPLLPAAMAGLDKCARGAWWDNCGQVTDPHRRCMHPDHSASDPMTAAPSLRTHLSASAGQRRFHGSCGPPLRHPRLR